MEIRNLYRIYIEYEYMCNDETNDGYFDFQDGAGCYDRKCLQDTIIKINQQRGSSDSSES